MLHSIELKFPGSAASEYLDQVSILSSLETETDSLSQVLAHQQCWLYCGEVTDNMRSP